MNRINSRIRDVGDMLDVRDRLHPPPNKLLRKQLQSVSDNINLFSQRGAAFIGIGPGNFLFEMKKGVLDRYYIPAARSREANKEFFDTTDRDADKMEKSLDKIKIEIEKEMKPRH